MTAPRHAVVLAAGRGSRLGAVTDEVPKPLVPVGGSALVGHQLAQMAARGVRDVVVVRGYRADAWDRLLDPPAGLTVRFVENAAWAATGSGRSLLAAARTLRRGEPVLVTHGDVVCDDAVLDGVLALASARPDGSAVAADRTWRPETHDEVVAWSRGGELLGVVKGERPSDGDEAGEFIGVSVLSGDFAAAFADWCGPRVAQDATLDYEQPLLSAFVQGTGWSCGVSYTDHVPWRNVNDAADLAWVREHLAIHG